MLLPLQTGWGSGSVPGFYGGFGRTNPIDLTSSTHFNFWINPDADQDYTIEINLQDDDDNDNMIIPSVPGDDEFQYSLVVSPTGPGAIAGGGWQLISIPLTSFFDDNSFLTGGNGVLDPFTSGNGPLINVVFAFTFALIVAGTKAILMYTSLMRVTFSFSNIDNTMVLNDLFCKIRVCFFLLHIN